VNQAQQHKHLVSFRSQAKLSVILGYSVSGFQGVVLTVCFAGHCKHLACGLRAFAIGGIDLLAALSSAGEL